MINVIVSTYQQYIELEILVKSFINQTDKRWKLWVIHDGRDESFDILMNKIKIEYNEFWNQIQFLSTSERYNDYGHSLRDYGLKNFHLPDKEFVLFTNGDNYYCPVFVEEMLKVVNDKIQIVYCDMVHSHNRGDSSAKGTYGFFNTQFQPYICDIGAFMIRCELAKKIGFNHRDHDADAHFIKELNDTGLTGWNIQKVPKVLFIHN